MFRRIMKGSLLLALFLFAALLPPAPPLEATPPGTTDPFARAPFLLMDEEAVVLAQDYGGIQSDVFLPNVVQREDGSRTWSERLDDAKTTWSPRPPLLDGKIGDAAVLLRNSRNEAFLAQVWEGDWLTMSLAPVDQGGYKAETVRKTVSTTTFRNSRIVAAAGDLNGDRATELVVGYRWTLGANEPRFIVASVTGFENPLEFSDSSLPRVHEKSGLRIAGGDADGDGKAEIAAMYVSEAGKYVVALLKADANLQLRLLGTHTLDIAPYRDTFYSADQFDIAFADWEGDGRAKIFCVAGYAGDGYGRNVRLLAVTIQDGRATFTTESRHSHKFFGDQGPILASAADINGNGKDELLLTNRWGSPPFERSELIAVYNKGDGSSGSASKYWSNDRLEIYRPISHLKTGRFTGSLHPSSAAKGGSHAMVLLHQTSLSNDGTFARLLRLEGDTLKEVSAARLGGFSNPDRAHLLVGDLDRDSMVLGYPTHITLENHVTPLLFMNEPPKHIDADDSGAVTNSTRRDDLFVQYAQSDSESRETTNIFEAESTLGGSASVEQKGGVDLGIVKAEMKLTTTVGGSTKDLRSEIARSYQSRSTSLTGATTRDDVLLYLSNRVHLWRYPILGWMSEPEGGGAKVPTYYQLSIPESEASMKFLPGLNVDWYHPAHMNGNVLSYPSRRAQIGDFAEDRRLSDNVEFGVGVGTAFTRGITWKDAFTRESLKSVEVKMNLDVELQASGSAQVEIFEVGGSTTASFHMDKRTTETNVAKTSVEKEKAFTVNIPAFSTPLGYQITPLMYRTGGGVLKTSHVVDVLNNRSLWTSRYSAPDPALNLPRLWRYVEGDGWKWAAADPLNPDARKIRGIFFRNSNGVDLGKNLPLGETTTIAVRVHNFSLVECPEVDVLFEAVPYGGAPAVVIGTARTPRIDLWGASEAANWRWATVAWNTAGMTEGNYTVRVTVNPDRRIPELAGRALNEPFDNNLGWYDVFVGRPRSAFEEGLSAANENLVAATLELTNTPADGKAFALGEVALLRGTLRNEGMLPVGNISLFFYDGNPDGGGKPIANRIVAGIVPGGEYAVVLTHTFDTPGPRSVFMRVVPKVGDPPEDNTVSVAVPVHGGGTGGGGCATGSTGAWTALLLAGLAPSALRRKER